MKEKLQQLVELLKKERFIETIVVSEEGKNSIAIYRRLKRKYQKELIEFKEIFKKDRPIENFDMELEDAILVCVICKMIQINEEDLFIEGDGVFRIFLAEKEKAEREKQKDLQDFLELLDQNFIYKVKDQKFFAMVTTVMPRAQI